MKSRPSITSQNYRRTSEIPEKNNTVSRRSGDRTPERSSERDQDKNIGEEFTEEIRENVVKNLKIDEIAKIVDLQMKTVHNAINSSLDSHKYLTEKRTVDMVEKYNKLLKKYQGLELKYQENLENHAQTVATYQTIIAKICGKLLFENKYISKDDLNTITETHTKSIVSDTGTRALNREQNLILTKSSINTMYELDDEDD